MSTTEFEAFQAWRKSRMNFWQLLAEGLVPSFAGDLRELEEFDSFRRAKRPEPSQGAPK